MTLEERVERLEDIESIRYLQAKYQRLLDSRKFDELLECFTNDAISCYDSKKMSYSGREEIVNFLSKVMSFKMPSSHLIHGGEIDIIDKENATGKWYLEDHLIHKIFLVKLHGTAVYECEYKKIDGKWYISKIGYKRNYQYVELRGPINLITLSKTDILKESKELRKKK